MSAAWRLVETYDVPSRIAMGLDEALLDEASAQPTLRLYTWAPDAISLGWFQDHDDVAAARSHPDVVRRLTGGGAIHHDAGELTFSVAVSEDEPLYRGRVSTSYERVHAVIEDALRSLGVEAPRLRRDEPAGSDDLATGMCFHDSTPLDVGWAVDGVWCKGVGTAQRRRRGRILHHGSIKLRASASEPGIASLEAVGVTTERDAVAAALVTAFEQRLGANLRRDEPSLELMRRAEELGARYGEPEFVRRSRRRRSRS